MGGFFEKLSYSLGNEDWLIEQQALQIRSDSRVLAVTASGDRPLNLLSVPCGELITIDANAVQNHLLHLKCAALEALDYHDYLAFLGLTPHSNRLKLWEEVSIKLNAASQLFWKNHKKWIEKGVIYQGTIEKLCGFVSTGMKYIRGKKIEQLFSFDDLEEQQLFLKEHWETPLWKKGIIFCLHPWITRFMIGDPGLYLTLGPSITPGQYIYDAIHSFLERRLAKESPLLSLVFQGKIKEALYPPYLKEEGGRAILPQLNKMQVHTAHLVEFLESAIEGSIDRFSLSDVASYLRHPEYIRMMKAIYRAAKPGARFCIRQFLSSHEIPEELNSYFHRDYLLEKKLQEGESCFLYRFHVGTIIK